MDLIENCYEAYRRAPDDLRRRFNQAFFEKIYVDERGEPQGEIAEPFRVILGKCAGASLPESEKPRDPISQAQGSQERHLVPLEGLEPPTCSLGRSCSSIELQRRGASSLGPGRYPRMR